MSERGIQTGMTHSGRWAGLRARNANSEGCQVGAALTRPSLEPRRVTAARRSTWKKRLIHQPPAVRTGGRPGPKVATPRWGGEDLP